MKTPKTALEALERELKKHRESNQDGQPMFFAGYIQALEFAIYTTKIFEERRIRAEQDMKKETIII